MAHEYGGATGYWQSGKDVHIGNIGGNLATAFGINDSGQLAGSSDTTQQHYSLDDINKQYPVTVRHAFLWQNGSFTDLGALPLVASANDPSFTAPPSSIAMAVNNAGQVVGSSDEPTFPHAFLWQQGKMTDLDTGLYSGSSAYGLNDAGQVVGINGGHAAQWQNGVVTDLGTLPNHQGSVAVAINSKGQVVGSSMPANPAVSGAQEGQRAILWQNGQNKTWERWAAPADARSASTVWADRGAGGYDDNLPASVVWACRNQFQQSHCVSTCSGAAPLSLTHFFTAAVRSLT